MRFLDIEWRGVSLEHGAQKGAMCQVRRPDLRAGQVVHVPEVHIVIAVVEHVNHLVGKHSMDHALVLGHILAHHDLVELGIVAAGDRWIAHLAGDVATQIDGTTGAL